jgi:hypothetical protein
MPEGRANQPQNGDAPARQRYTRAWEDLRDVLARLLHAGWTTQDAKEDVCRALAEAPLDRKIDFRVMVQVEEDDDDGAPPGYRNIKTVVRSEGHWLNSQQVKIPTSLKPSDFDWEHSRPTEPWLTTFASSFAYPRIGEEPERREIDSIELRTSDVGKVLLARPKNTVNAGQAHLASHAQLKSEQLERAVEENELQFYHELPADPPRATQKNPAAAYTALRTKFPEGRIPKMPMEKLVKMISPIAYKNSGLRVGREDIERALKLRQ